MRQWKKKWIVLLLVTALTFTTGLSAAAQEQSWAQEPTAAGMMADLALVRPLGIAATVLGTAFFIVSVPFSALGGNTGESFKKLMAEPAKFTFVRPLGFVE